MSFRTIAAAVLTCSLALGAFPVEYRAYANQAAADRGASSQSAEQADSFPSFFDNSFAAESFTEPARADARGEGAVALMSAVSLDDAGASADGSVLIADEAASAETDGRADSNGSAEGVQGDGATGDASEQGAGQAAGETDGDNAAGHDDFAAGGFRCD